MLSILWYTKFQLVTVKYNEVEALFCKMPHHVEKFGSNAMSVHTKSQYQVTVFGRDPVLEIRPILWHLNGHNFLIPNPRELVFMDFSTKSDNFWCTPNFCERPSDSGVFCVPQEWALKKFWWIWFWKENIFETKFCRLHYLTATYGSYPYQKTGVNLMH